MAADLITFVITSRFMASVWKRSNSQYLTAYFGDHTGLERRISTKETDWKKAQRLAGARLGDYCRQAE
jgi:Tfp pilus assembly protein PilX